MTRQQQLIQWLAQVLGEEAPLSMVAGDASFRRYYRVKPSTSCFERILSRASHPQSNMPSPPSFIVMDAPPEQENCQPFINVQHIFYKAGVRVPPIYAFDETLGFMVLGDFGDRSFESMIQSAWHNAPKVEAGQRAPLPPSINNLYRSACSALVRLQQYTPALIENPQHHVPPYDEKRLVNEMALCPQWFLEQHLKIRVDDKVWDEIVHLIAARVVAQPQVIVHRDYHVRNLMWCSDVVDKVDIHSVGMIDFQDAVIGPMTYDIVSLLKDAYVVWPAEQALDWLVRYWEEAKKAGLPIQSDFAQFYQDYEWMGLQRHLKVLGIFARLYYRDGKSRYLENLPAVFNYAFDVIQRYRAFGPLEALFEEIESKLIKAH